MREARDWVEYCNGAQSTALARLRAEHGFPEPHRVRYWGIGNEVDGPWQVGTKTPFEYARAYTEYAKVMRWADPSIKLLASAVSWWEGDPVERIQLLLEQAPELIDYLSIHWYVGNPGGDLPAYLAVSELIEDRLAVVEGISRSRLLGRRAMAPVPIAVDEWNVWYRSTPDARDPAYNGLEETYDLADALVVAMHFNAFFRHARTVRMANLAQLVNVIAPMITTTDDLLLQSTFYPFELLSGHLRQPAVHDRDGEHVRLHDLHSDHPHPDPFGFVRAAGSREHLPADGLAHRPVHPGLGIARRCFLPLPRCPVRGRAHEPGAHGLGSAAPSLAHVGLTGHPIASHHRDLALGRRQHALLQQRPGEHLPGAV
jgi:alpha-L-arabinofuranosidase